MSCMSLEVNNVKNEQSRHGGFSPSQWVLGVAPRRPGDRHDEDTYADLGILSEKLDGPAAFKLSQDLRTEARRAFVRQDCGKRVA